MAFANFVHYIRGQIPCQAFGTVRCKYPQGGKMIHRDNLSYIKFYGLGIPDKGQLATVEQQEEIKMLIRTVKPAEDVQSDNEINSDGNRIVLYLLDGNRTEITSFGQSKVQIAQVINEVTFKQIVTQPELRTLLDNLPRLI
jgi:hypothetical protein